jgi:hypothetical protein
MARRDVHNFAQFERPGQSMAANCHRSVASHRVSQGAFGAAGSLSWYRKAIYSVRVGLIENEDTEGTKSLERVHLGCGCDRWKYSPSASTLRTIHIIKAMEEGTRTKKTVFIGGISDDVDESTIYENFSIFGAVQPVFFDHVMDIKQVPQVI